MLLIFDMPSVGSGSLLMQAIQASNNPFVLVVRDKNRTSSSWSNELQAQVTLHECQPYTIEAIDGLLDNLGIHKVDGIVCVLDGLMPIAAHFAERFAVPFASPEAISRWVDKGISRQFCAEANLPIPPFRWVNDLAPDQLSTWTHYPAIIKPRRGSGSLGVQRINTSEELLNFFQHKKETFAPNEWMLEAMLSGAIYSVEGYVVKGDLHFLGISDRTWGPQPLFVEEGLSFPVLEGTQLAQKLYDTAKQVVLATNYHHGFFHIELMVHMGEPYIIELNPRCGGRIPMLVSLAYKQDFYREFLVLFTGSVPSFGVPLCGAFAFYVFPHKQGIWAGFNDSILKQYPSIKLVLPNSNRHMGEWLGPVYSIRDNIMLVYGVAETTELAHAILRAFISEVPMYLRIEPKLNNRRKRASVLYRIKKRIRKMLSS
jgi:argininosuccinate lyase